MPHDNGYGPYAPPLIPTPFQPLVPATNSNETLYIGLGVGGLVLLLLIVAAIVYARRQRPKSRK